jgi:hypothetical protein
MMVAETVSEASEVCSISTQLITREYFIAELELHLFLNKCDIRNIFSQMFVS